MEHGKKSSCNLYKEIESTKIYDEKNVDQQSHALVTRAARASEPKCDCSNLSAASMLVLTQSYGGRVV